MFPSSTQQRRMATGRTAWYSCSYSGRSCSFPHRCPCLCAPRCPVLPLVWFQFAVLLGVFFNFILHYFTLLFYFWILLLPAYPSPSFFVCFCLIPVIPLDHQPGPTSSSATISLANPEVSILNYQSALCQPSAASMAAVAQRSMPLQTGTAQICARPDPFQQALIVCPPGFQGK